jgi:hypothetical protein
MSCVFATLMAVPARCAGNALLPSTDQARLGAVITLGHVHPGLWSLPGHAHTASFLNKSIVIKRKKQKWRLTIILPPTHCPTT